MAIKLVQNTSTHNRRKKIHNYFLNVPSTTNFDCILLVVTKDNNIFELQGLLKHNDFTNKPTTRFTHAM
jgi:hypothetical protein